MFIDNIFTQITLKLIITVVYINSDAFLWLIFLLAPLINIIMGDVTAYQIFSFIVETIKMWANV